MHSNEGGGGADPRIGGSQMGWDRGGKREGRSKTRVFGLTQRDVGLTDCNYI